MPLYIAGYFIEFVVLLSIGRRDLAKSYVAAIKPFMTDLNGLLQSRRDVQLARQVGDVQIMKRMYPGLAKLRGLRNRGFSISVATH